jgi:alpha-N-arabinofuranosidase
MPILHNPILPGFHPDPSICRLGEDYFLVTSSFEYFPGVPLFHSRDLLNWRQIGHVLTRPSQLNLLGVKGSDGVYAPTIRCHNGRFYIVTTNVTMGGNFLVWTDDPFGAWSEPVWLDQGGIDPSLLFDEGRVYLTSTSSGGGRDTPLPPEFGRWAAVQSEIDIETGRRLSETRPLWSGTGGKYPEGPHLYHIGAYYYLLLAEGGTEYGHMVTIARSNSPWGPFVPCPHNPILTHRSTDLPIQATGHADLIEAHDGSWWLVCLGVRPNPHDYPARYHLGRESFLAPMRWTEDGWPVVGLEYNEGRLEMEAELAHALPPHPWPAEPVCDEFDGDSLAPVWNFLRAPRPSSISLSARPGWLTLHGSADTLDGRGVPAWVGRRQQHVCVRMQTLLDYAPTGPGEEAGLTVRMDEEHHVELAIAQRNGARVALLRRRIGSLVGEEGITPLPAGPIELVIEADHTWYRFAWRLPGGASVPMGQAETRYLTTEVAGGFTGVFVAMYAVAPGGPQHAPPAAFGYMEYQPK